MEKLLITLKEASEYSGISVRRLRDIVKENSYLCRRNGNKILIHRKYLEEYINTNVDLY